MNTTILLIIFLTLIYISYYFVELNENYLISIKNRTIKNDGFCVLYNDNYNYNDELLKNDILNMLPDNYQFINYEYKILNGSLYTFHRDVTSSENIYKTKYNVYTAIIYQYDGDLISLCPNSNKSYPFVNSRIININGKSGTVVIFNCDILHAGAITDSKRKVIQYKLCHNDDMKKLNHLNNVKTIKNGNYKKSIIHYPIRKLSYYFQFPINYILYPLMIKRENDNTVIGKIQKYIPLDYYNNI